MSEPDASGQDPDEYFNKSIDRDGHPMFEPLFQEHLADLRKACAKTMKTGGVAQTSQLVLSRLQAVAPEVVAIAPQDPFAAWHFTLHMCTVADRNLPPTLADDLRLPLKNLMRSTFKSIAVHITDEEHELHRTAPLDYFEDLWTICKSLTILDGDSAVWSGVEIGDTTWDDVLRLQHDDRARRDKRRKAAIKRQKQQIEKERQEALAAAEERAGVLAAKREALLSTLGASLKESASGEVAEPRKFESRSPLSPLISLAASKKAKLSKPSSAGDDENSLRRLCQLSALTIDIKTSYLKMVWKCTVRVNDISLSEASSSMKRPAVSQACSQLLAMLQTDAAAEFRDPMATPQAYGSTGGIEGCSVTFSAPLRAGDVIDLVGLCEMPGEAILDALEAGDGEGSEGRQG
jgi:hypothetical protein